MPDGEPLSHIIPPDTSSALGKGMTVLSAILTAPKPPSLNDIAERTALPRPTVFRVVKQLEETLMITRAPDGDKYLVGPNLMSLATDAMSAFMHASPVRAILSGLVHEIGETCNLGVLDRDSVVYIDRVECSWPLRLQMGVGTHVSMHATALGKLLVAHLPTRSRRRIIRASPLEKFTDFTITDPKLLEAEFIIFLHALQLRLHLRHLELQAFNLSGQHPDLLFKLAEAHIDGSQIAVGLRHHDRGRRVRDNARRFGHERVKRRLGFCDAPLKRERLGLEPVDPVRFRRRAGAGDQRTDKRGADHCYKC